MVLLHDMGQSLAHLLVHAIFSTKDRRPFPHSEEIRNEIYADMAGSLKNLNCHPIKIGGVEEPVHVFCWLSKNIAFSDLMGRLRVGRPFRADRFISLHPGLKRPTSPSGSTERLD